VSSSLPRPKPPTFPALYYSLFLNDCNPPAASPRLIYTNLNTFSSPIIPADPNDPAELPPGSSSPIATNKKDPTDDNNDLDEDNLIVSIRSSYVAPTYY
jgi:hypothetical protein